MSGRNPRVSWTPEMDRRMMLYLINPGQKDFDFEHIASKIPNATPKAIMERTAKLYRERKALDAGTAENKSTTVGETAKKKTPTKPRAPKAGPSAKASGKRKRVEEDEGGSDDGTEVTESVEEKPKKMKGAAMDNKEDDVEILGSPTPTSVRAKANSMKLKPSAAEKMKSEVKEESESAGSGFTVPDGKSTANVKKQEAEDEGVGCTATDDATKKEEEEEKECKITG